MDKEEVNVFLRHFTWPDYLVFVLMLVSCSIIGIYFAWKDHQKRKKSDVDKEQHGSEALDYLVGGRKMKVFPVAMSLVASLISGIGLLGTSTEIYFYGIHYCYVLVGICLTGLILHYVYLPVYHELKLTSLYEYLNRRFDKKVRLFGSLIFVLSTIVKIPIMIYIPALTFSQVTGIHLSLTASIVCLICIFYTCIGGIKAVVWTDVIQGFVMIGSLIMVAWMATKEAGGVYKVLSINYESTRIESPIWNMDPRLRNSVWVGVIGGWAFHSALNGTCQSMIQRYVSIPSLKEAQQTVWLFVGGAILILSFAMYNGLLLYAVYHDCDPLKSGMVKKKDQMIPLLVMQVLGGYPGLAGCFVAGVFSASLSSLSTGLNSITAVVLEDLIKPFRRESLSERSTAILMRTTVVIIGLLCTGMVFIVEHLGPVLELAISLAGVTFGPLLGVFTVGLFFPWVDTKNALIGGSTGLICGIYIIIRTHAETTRHFVLKPISVEGCLQIFNNNTEVLTQNVTKVDEVSHTSFEFHHIAYLYYSLTCCLITVIISNISSVIFKTKGNKTVDPMLLTPIARKLFMTPNKNTKECDNHIVLTYTFSKSGDPK